MRLKNRVVGFALTGSHCTVEAVFATVEAILREGAEVVPIVSTSFNVPPTRFGDPEVWVEHLRALTGHEPLRTFAEVETLGPGRKLDVLAIIPCTGNTMAKLANAINDTAVVFAAKAQLRNLRPVVLGITSNDCLGLGAKNLATLLATKNVYFVPFGQDNPTAKPNSLSAKLELTVEAIWEALQGRQLQPLLVSFAS